MLARPAHPKASGAPGEAVMLISSPADPDRAPGAAGDCMDGLSPALLSPPPDPEAAWPS